MNHDPLSRTLSYRNNCGIWLHDADLEHCPMKKKIDVHMLFFPYLCSRFIFRNLRDANWWCFRDILQPAFYQFVPGMIRLLASWYSECTVFTVNLCYLQVLAMYKKVATYIVMCDSRIFWKKSPSGKNDQKWSKMTPKQGF